MRITKGGKYTGLVSNASSVGASGVVVADTGGYFPPGATLEEILEAIGAGSSPDSFLKTTLGGVGVVQALGTLGATELIDLANANKFWGTLDQDCTITTVGWTNLKDCAISVELIENGTGGWTPTFTGVTWIGGTPTWTTTAGTVTHVVLFSRDGGTTIYGAVVGGGGGGSSDLDAIIAASSGQDIADALAGAAAPDAGNVFATMADVGGGSGRAPLDTYSLNGTYGDDFTAGSLSGIWTRRNFTSGAETYQLGKDATYMRVSTSGRANGDGYFQTAPGGDWTFAMSFVARVSIGYNNVGIACVNSSGTGVVTGFYNSPSALLIMALTTYSTYGGTFSQTTARTSIGTTTQLETKQWMYLRKSGTNYYAAFSFDGEIWSDETAAFSSAHTVDRVGILLAPLGNIPGLIDIDVFNKIA